ncbi:helix-turn-helix domain-containing protein [Marinicella sp. W31]|uniref:helix-turn-helix domain-containing protein n=1 Tax=Marinicella sp. W31 TaxID=3023713 RepID=UPI003756905D
MNHVNQQFKTGHQTSSALALFIANAVDRMKSIEPLILLWWCLALSIVCSSAARFTTESIGLTYYVLMIAGSGGCAWFWLLSRALFRNRQDLKTSVFISAGVVIAIEAIAALMPQVAADGIVSEIRRVFSNTASMVCIAVIVLVWNETLNGYSKIRSHAERRFRIIFLSVFNLVVAIAVLWASGASPDSLASEWNPALLTICGIIGLLGSRAAVHYRLKLTREKPERLERSRLASPDHQNSECLAQRILMAIKDEALLTRPNLKISDFADQIDEQEYKVTRCITSHLQYRNFNHFLNSYRIEYAKTIFNDPDKRHLTIATIAFDCGFNSLGPFNRAFKQHTGITPREFRGK